MKTDGGQNGWSCPPGMLRVYLPPVNLEKLVNFLLRPWGGYTHSPADEVTPPLVAGCHRENLGWATGNRGDEGGPKSERRKW